LCTWGNWYKEYLVNLLANSVVIGVCLEL